MSFAMLPHGAKSPIGSKPGTSFSAPTPQKAEDHLQEKSTQLAQGAKNAKSAAKLQWSISSMPLEDPGRTARNASHAKPDGHAALPPAMRRALGNPGGERLPHSVEAMFGGKFGHNLSQVTVRHDGEASEAVQSIGANAFAHRSRLFFREGAYQPHSSTGQGLLAHELAHVVQQTRGPQSSPPAAHRSNLEDHAKTASRHHLEGRPALVAGPSAPVGIAADNGFTSEDDEAKLSSLADQVVDLEDDANRDRAAAGVTTLEIGKKDEEAQKLRDTIRASVTAKKSTKKPKGKKTAKTVKAAPAATTGPNKSLDLNATPEEVEADRRALAKAEVLNSDPAEGQRIRRAIENTQAAAPGAKSRAEEAERKAEIQSRTNRIASLRNDVDVLEQIGDMSRDDWKNTSSIGTGLPRVLGRSGDVIQKEDFQDTYILITRAKEALNAGKLSEADKLIDEATETRDALASRLEVSTASIESGGSRAIALVKFPDRVVRAALPPAAGAAYSFLQDSLQQNIEVAHGLRDSVDYFGNAVDATWGAVLNKVSGGVGNKFGAASGLKGVGRTAVEFAAGNVFASAATGQAPSLDSASLLGMALGSHFSGGHGSSEGAGEGSPAAPQPEALPAAQPTAADTGGGVAHDASATNAGSAPSTFDLPFVDFAPTHEPTSALAATAVPGAADVASTPAASTGATASENDTVAKAADAPHPSSPEAVTAPDDAAASAIKAPDDVAVQKASNAADDAAAAHDPATAEAQKTPAKKPRSKRSNTPPRRRAGSGRKPTAKPRNASSDVENQGTSNTSDVGNGAQQTNADAPTVDALANNQVAQSNNGGTRGTEEVFGELGRELGLKPVVKHPASIRDAVAWAQATEPGSGPFVNPDGTPRNVDAAVHPYGSTETVTDELSLTGKDAEAAHIGPTAALWDQPGYNRDAALTQLLPPSIHEAFDAAWLKWGRGLAAAGQGETTVDALRAAVNDAINQTPGLSSRTKSTFQWLLDMELSRLNLTGDRPVRVPGNE